MRLGFIGGGTMAEAMVAGLLKRKAVEAGDVTVSDVVKARRDHLRKVYGVGVVADNRKAAAGADLVVLAVKPQQLREVAESLRGSLGPDQAVLSIVAGVATQTIASGLGHDSVVRAMPNMPGQLGVGITAWTATPSVDEKQRGAVRTVLSALGVEVYVADEKLLDVATALSGSGPAYVFLFIEALIDAAVYLGMPRELAQQLAVQTVSGSGTMVSETGEHPAVLRDRVTSPGGTTAEGLLALEEGGFRATVMSAVLAAHGKAIELGEESRK